MSQPKRNTTKPSPMRLVLVLLLSIFTVEFGIMALFLVMPPIAQNEWVMAVIDSSILSVMLFPVLFFVVFRPLARQVTELVQAEKELERTQAILQDALRVKSDFMANVTHELKTPLNSVIGFAELLKDEVPGPLNAKQAEFATDILASGQQLLTLVEGILEMSRFDVAGVALARAPVEIGAALEERVAAHRKAAEARGIAIQLDVAPAAGRAALDPQAVRRMLDTLLYNAIKFNRDGGAVTVSARRADGALEIAVADTGIGIAQEDLTKLFKPFAQLDAGLARKHGGVGAGLALARRLAELHGGTIEVESEPGKGSLFTLRFPIQDDP
jgi:Amt family ammonium transporter